MAAACLALCGLAPVAMADCAPAYQQALVDKLFELQAPGAKVDAAALQKFLLDEREKCPGDYQGAAFSVYLMGAAVGHEADPQKKAAYIDDAFTLMRQASDQYDPQMKPFTYTDQNGVEGTMWAWGHAKTTLQQALLPHMVALAEAGTIEPSLTGGSPGVCPYGEVTRLADDTEGRFWLDLMKNSGFFGTAGLGNEDERAEYDRNLAIYDRRVGFAQNRLAALAVACPENRAQLLFDRARVLGNWAEYSHRQMDNINRAIEDFRVNRDRRDAVIALGEEMERQRNARAKMALEAYEAFYAAEAETNSHLDFKLGDKQTYFNVVSWAKNQ